MSSRAAGGRLLARATDRNQNPPPPLLYSRPALVEWLEGYIPRFGVTAVDRENGFKRHPKDSSKFLKQFFATAMGKK